MRRLTFIAGAIALCLALCPLPPAENRLDLVIDAGEKSYHPGTPKSRTPMPATPTKG